VSKRVGFFCWPIVWGGRDRVKSGAVPGVGVVPLWAAIFPMKLMPYSKCKHFKILLTTDISVRDFAVPLHHSLLYAGWRLPLAKICDFQIFGWTDV